MKKSVFRPLFCLIACFTVYQGSAQLWDDFIDRTFVFEIGNREALRLIKSNPRDSLITRMLHTPVGELTGEQEYSARHGHFIHANIVRNEVIYRYVPVMPFQVFLYKEYGILTLQVVDQRGEVRRDAKVKICGRWRLLDRRIPFDEESHTYRVDDWSEKSYRILTVEVDGFRALFDLTKHMVNPRYDVYGRDNYSPDFYSYMVTDKNRYRPGETVRFKSYALTGSRRALRKELEVWMETENGRFKKMGQLQPYNPGGYAGEVLLHDSLSLVLDRNYRLQLRQERGRTVARTVFRYEDYVLYDNTLEIGLSRGTHYFPDDNILSIKVTDANGMITPGLKADVTVRLRNVDRSFLPVLYLPEELMSLSVALRNDAPTEVIIPAGVFGEANGTYEVGVSVLTHDGQPMVSSETAQFRRLTRDIEVSSHGDALRFDLMQNGKSVPAYAELNYEGTEDSAVVSLPYEEPFVQSRRGYNFRLPGCDHLHKITAGAIDPGLVIEGGISADSFKVSLRNPLQLDVAWYVYRGNVLLAKGAGAGMDVSFPDTGHEFTYYTEIFYFMGDQEHTLRRSFVPRKESLTIRTDLPDRVFPGQSVDATVEVTDNLGYPVRNVDLTAFAFNKLLGYDVPDMEYYGAQPNVREQRSSFSIDRRGYGYTMPLDYGFWKNMAGLDEAPYYRFSYPGGRVFTATIETPDGTTEVAPYIMRRGAPENVLTVEIDDKPVWFSWAEQPRSYSFPVDPDTLHTITMRINNRAFIIKDLSFLRGHKTILSVDPDNLPDEVSVVSPGRYTFNAVEVRRYSPLLSILPVRRQSGVEWLYRDGDSLLVYHPLLSPRMTDVLTGPVTPGTWRYGDGVEYKHEGGFRYEYEGNVVYKQPAQVIPDHFGTSVENRVTGLGDFHLTAKELERHIERAVRSGRYWSPSAIHISQDGLNLKFRLPVDKDSTGVANLLFVDLDNCRVTYPDMYRAGNRAYSHIAPGAYDAMLIYNDGKFIRVDSLVFGPSTYLEVDMGVADLCEADSLSLAWRDKYALQGMIGDNVVALDRPGRSYTIYQPAPSWNSISGFVYDDMDEPLPGAVVSIKGTATGTVTDLDGYFKLSVPPGNQQIQVSYLGFVTREITMAAGSIAHIVLEADYQMLDDVVVIGYGVAKKMNMTGSLAGVTGSLTPSLPAEEFEDDEPLTADPGAEDRLYRELSTLGRIRSNFSDVGFWEPRLVTDRMGRASFEVKFPDNITKWDAVIYAMNRRLQTGTYRKSIRSYMPITAELRMPGFLVEGDRSLFTSLLRNFTSGELVSGSAVFISDTDTLAMGPVGFTTSFTDTATFMAGAADSLAASYIFSREDGYTDGEQHTIAILPRGTEIAEGGMGFIREGEKIQISAAEDENVELLVTGDQLDIYMDVASYLSGYKYDCNEQLASKLIGLLTTRLYMQYHGAAFPYDRRVNDIIRRLLDNRNENMLWSWFGRDADSSPWMSAHILGALQMARDSGYAVNLDLRQVRNTYLDAMGYREPSMEDIQILHALCRWGMEDDYRGAVDYWEKRIARQEFLRDSTIAAEKQARGYSNAARHSYLPEKLMLWDIRRMRELGYSPDSISAYLKTDITGGVYCDDNIKRLWYRNELMTTLLAYNFVRADPSLSHYKEPMQSHILGTRAAGWNTYYGSCAVATVFPDLSAGDRSEGLPTILEVTGNVNETVTTFPYGKVLKPGESVVLEKRGALPLIYSCFTRRLVTGEHSGDGFAIRTTLSGDGKMVSGQPVKLTVEVEVSQKNAEYVMIEVPIPAGCDYASKPDRPRYPEVYREYYRDKTVIFCRTLPEGRHLFDIELIPRFGGTYSINPAKVELMYFPVVNANTDLKVVEIE